jgi:hypothetical protein
MAWPRVSDEPVIQWALAGSREVPGDGADHADLLIEAAGSQDILPSALAALAAAGFTPRRVKVHRQPDGRQLIELGMEPLEPPAIERIARRLCVLAKVLKVAFRTGSGVGGWLVGHSAGVALQSNAPSGSRAPSEAA